MDRNRPSRRSLREAAARRQSGRRTERSSRSCRTATITASFRSSRTRKNRSATSRRPRRAIPIRSGQPTDDRSSSCVSQAAAACRRSPLAQPPSPWSLWVGNTDAASGRSRPGRAAPRLSIRSRDRGRHQPALGGRRHHRLLVLPGRLAASVFDPASAAGRQAEAVDARRLHGRIRIAVSGPETARLQREYRRRCARHRSASHLQGCGRRFQPARRADKRPGHRVEPGRHRQRPDGRVPRIDRTALAAAHDVSINGGTPVTLAADHLPKDLPSTALVTPEPVTFRAADGVEVHGQLFKAANGAARRPRSSMSTADRRARCFSAGTT